MRLLNGMKVTLIFSRTRLLKLPMRLGIMPLLVIMFAYMLYTIMGGFI